MMTSSPQSPETAVRPSHIRYLIVGVAMLAAVLLYLERVCVSVADVYIREDLRIGKAEMDWVLGAFFIAYALGQVPSGWLSQRYGPRMMMAIYMLGWSIFGVFIALAQDFWTLFFARFLLGLSQAGAYPTAALLVKRWIPDRSRGMASGIVAFGGRFGGAGATWLTGVLIVVFVPISTRATVSPGEILEPTLLAKQLAASEPSHLQPIRMQIRERLTGSRVGPDEWAAALNAVILTPGTFDGIDPGRVKLAKDGLAIRQKPPAQRTEEESRRLNRLTLEEGFPGAIQQLHGQGWRPTLMVYGLAGLVVAALVWVFSRDWPREHPWCNPTEVALIEAGQSKVGEISGSDAIPWRELFFSRNQWMYSLCSIFGNMGWVFLITLMPRFLSEKFAVPVDQRGLMTTVPLVAAAFGMLAGGWTTDRLVRAYGRRWGRAIPMGVFKIPCVIALLLCPWLPSAWAVTAALAVMALAMDFGVPAVWAFAQDTGGKQVGAVLGWANMWGNLGAGIAPILLGGIAGRFGWDLPLYAAASAFVLSGGFALMTRADEPLFGPRKPAIDPLADTLA